MLLEPQGAGFSGRAAGFSALPPPTVGMRALAGTEELIPWLAYTWAPVLVQTKATVSHGAGLPQALCPCCAVTQSWLLLQNPRPGQEDRLLHVFRPIFTSGCADNLLGNWAVLEAHEAPDVTWDGRFSGTCELLTLHAFPSFRVLPGILVLGDSCATHVVNSVFGFRQADGRKVLRSSIREFLCSEAMFHLGVPTTRAGACVTSESTVVRDVFYDGNPKYEQCTVVLRIASTFIR